jgi:hypothetical protein
MKNISRNYYVLISLLFLLVSHAWAIGPLKVGFSGGISIPNEAVSNVLNSGEEVDWESDKNGYNLGLNLRFDIPLTDWGLQGGISYHNFPESEGIYSSNKEKKGAFTINKSIIAFSAGINYELFSVAEIVDFYIGTAPTYNYIIYTVELLDTGISIPLIDDGESVSDGRLGLNFSTGIDVNAVVFTGNIEAKYSMINLVGTDDGEDLKSFFALSLGIYF